MYNIVLSEESKQDMQNILDYISLELHNPESANKIVNEIEKDITSLQEFPARGSSLAQISALLAKYRFILCENYYIFYKIEQSKVTVLRVLNQKQEYIRKLLIDD